MPPSECIAAYTGLIAAPGTPKAVLTPSRSRTWIAAWAARIFIEVLLAPAWRRRRLGGDARRRRLFALRGERLRQQPGEAVDGVDVRRCDTGQAAELHHRPDQRVELRLAQGLDVLQH